MKTIAEPIVIMADFASGHQIFDIIMGASAETRGGTDVLITVNEDMPKEHIIGVAMMVTQSVIQSFITRELVGHEFDHLQMLLTKQIDKLHERLQDIYGDDDGEGVLQ